MAKLIPPDHPEANRKGCTCPNAGNNGGSGTLSDPKEGTPVRTFTVNPACPVHSNPRAWYGGLTSA